MQKSMDNTQAVGVVCRFILPSVDGQHLLRHIEVHFLTLRESTKKQQSITG